MLVKNSVFWKILNTSNKEKFWTFSFLQFSLNNLVYIMYLLYILRVWVLFYIINKEHHFQKFLRISSDEKFWVLNILFQVFSMNFPLFGTNVSFLFMVLFFYHLISRNLVCCFSFFSCLHYGYLQVFQGHWTLNARFISSLFVF